MATHVSASAVFPIPVEAVWKQLRDFTFPARLLHSVIASVHIEEGKSQFEVGAVRDIKWKSGESRKQRLIELSDQFRTIAWETIDADPPSETSAAITSIKLFRITETNGTLVQWSSDFAADVKGDFIKYEEKAYHETLAEIRRTLQGTH